MSPTLHNVIILHWLNLIHPKLRDMVTQRFSKELRNSGYASIWPEISRSIDIFLKDISNEDASICRFNPVDHKYPQSNFNRSPWRGRGSTQRFRGNTNFNTQNDVKGTWYLFGSLGGTMI